jgi:cytidine deaminase
MKAINKKLDNNTDYSSLVQEALAAREMAYAPYSGYKVGAALLTEEGKVFRGCNIESASFSPSNCAERTAFFKAVSEGYYNFKAIAVVGGHKDTPLEQLGLFAPCGVCRQVMSEFCGQDFKIIVAKSPEDYQIFTLHELLPLSFGPDDVPLSKL